MRQSEVPPVPYKMPRVEKKGSFEQRCNWTAVAREHVQNIGKAMRKSKNLQAPNLSDALAKRRIRTAVEYTDKIIERYKDVPGCEPAWKDEIGDDWLYLNIIPLITYNHIETRSYLLFAASIWILDEILLPEDPEKRKQLFRILPKNERDIESLFNFPDCWHPCYEYELILSVMYVLYCRNRGIGPEEKDDDDTERVIISSLEAKNSQHADTPDRRAFDALMALIPEESVRRAAAYFEELFWQWTDRYFDCMGLIRTRIREGRDRVNGYVDEYNRIREELMVALSEMAELRKNRNRPVKPPVLNPLMMNPPPMNLFEQFAAGAGIGSSFPGDMLPVDELTRKTLRITGRMDAVGDKAIEEMDRFEKLDNQKRVFALDLLDLGYIRADECEKEYGSEVAEKMRPLRILKPFEACFGLLWLIDSDSDLPWLFGCGVGLMNEVAESLPWGVFEYKEYHDPIWNPDEEEYAENLRLAAAKPSSIPEWYERSIVPKKGEMFSFDRSMAQVLYEETGCLMPRDIRKYDGRQKMFRKYGVPSKDINTMLLLSTALTHARRSDHALNFDENILQIWDELEQEEAGGEKVDSKKKQENRPPTAEELAEQVKLLQEENKKLRVSLHETEKTARDVRQELLSVRGSADLERRELADLREVIFNLDHEPEEEEAETSVDDSVFPYEVRKNTVVFGGHDSWLKAIRPMLTGDIRFVDRDLVFSVNLIRNADIIWIQPNAMSHSQYYRVVDAARQYGKPVRYFTCASAAKSAVQLMEADK